MQRIKITNFMSIKSAQLDFDELGILNIKGYNDSGKSNILRSLEVCLMHKYKQAQAKFIRDDEEFFRVEVTFADGVKITREKHRTGTSLYEMHNRAGELLFTTKVGRSYGKVDDVPNVIAEYLGLVVTDSVYLNSQAVQDPKLLVETTGSQNFAALHEVLQVDEIARSIAMANTDRNVVSREVNELEISIQGKKESLSTIPDYRAKDLVALKAKEALIDELQDRVTITQSLWGTLVARKEIPDLPVIDLVNSDRYKVISEIQKNVVALSNIHDLPDVEVVDSSRMTILTQIMSAARSIEATPDLPELPLLSSSRFEAVETLGSTIDSYSKLVKVGRDLVSSLNEATAELDQLHTDMHAAGYILHKCVFCEKESLVTA